jgi:hypothetical protein
MADIVTQRHIGALGALLRLSAASSVVATGAVAATTTGATIDRMGFNSGSMPNTIAGGIVYDATLASGKTLAFAYAYQDSDDGVNFSDYSTGTTAALATGASATTSTVAAGQVELGISLTSARRYIRLNHAALLSATTTDTAVSRAVGFAAGFDRLPQ